jgi:hypothetical protein
MNNTISLGRSYYYDPEDKVLFRINIDEKKHLMWEPPFKGTPCFNKSIYDQYKDKAKTIGARSDKHKWSMPIELFEEKKKLVKYIDEQYGCDNFFWIIESLGDKSVPKEPEPQNRPILGINI